MERGAYLNKNRQKRKIRATKLWKALRRGLKGAANLKQAAEDHAAKKASGTTLSALVKSSKSAAGGIFGPSGGGGAGGFGFGLGGGGDPAGVRGWAACPACPTSISRQPLTSWAAQ